LPDREWVPFVWQPGPSGGWRGPFNLPDGGTIVHETTVTNDGGPLQGASIFAWSSGPFSELNSTISWRFEQPPTIPNEYVLFQTFRPEVRTGLYANVGDVLRLELSQDYRHGNCEVRWYVNGDHLHTWPDEQRWSVCDCRSRWTVGLSAATVGPISINAWPNVTVGST
jgi:hypothetical protein